MSTIDVLISIIDGGKMSQKADSFTRRSVVAGIIAGLRQNEQRIDGEYVCVSDLYPNIYKPPVDKPGIRDLFRGSKSPVTIVHSKKK